MSENYSWLSLLPAMHAHVSFQWTWKETNCNVFRLVYHCINQPQKIIAKLSHYQVASWIIAQVKPQIKIQGVTYVYEHV